MGTSSITVIERILQAKLESRLAVTYRQLTALNHTLAAIAIPKGQSVLKQSKGHKGSGRSDVAQAAYIRVGGQASKLLNLLEGVLKDLLDLSVLVPAAPWVRLVLTK